MPEEKTKLGNQTAPEKKSDAAKLPNAPPKTEKPPDKNDGIKPASAAETKKPEDKTGTVKPPPAEVGKADASGKDSRKATVPTGDVKKPEASVKSPPAPAEVKKPDAPTDIPGKVSGNDTAPVSGAEKSGAAVKPPAKAADEKKLPLNKPVPPPAQKTEPSAKIMLGGKLHDPITPPKAADPPKGLGEQKGVRVTQIFEDRLDYPDEKALNSLPIPKEGEGFSMRLHPAYFYQFLDHPFSVNREVKDYIELYESIRDNGINEPVKARPREKGGLELISGHRRHDIASRLNYPVPVIIAQVDDDTARVEVVDGNLHRMDIPTSELARAAKMKMEALARKAGRRSKMEQLTSPEPKKRTDQIVAEDMGISRNQVNRLVKINDLVPELKQQVDDKKLPFNTAVELAYLKPDEQTKVVDVMKKEQIVPSMAQATALKEASRHADTMQKNLPSLAPAHKVDENKITSIIKPKKAPELKVTFTGAELKDFFPGEMPSVAEVKRVVFDALKIREEAYKRQAKRQAAKDAIKSPEH